MLLHPFLAKISKATTSNALLARQTVFFVSSRCSRDQNHSQYAPLKTTCINEVNIFFSKIKSLHVHHIAYIRAAAPTKINLLSFILMPVSQFLSICVVDFDEINPVATWTTLQMILTWSAMPVELSHVVAPHAQYWNWRGASKCSEMLQPRIYNVQTTDHVATHRIFPIHIRKLKNLLDYFAFYFIVQRWFWYAWLPLKNTVL